MHVNETRYIFANDRRPKGHNLWRIAIKAGGVDEMLTYIGDYAAAKREVMKWLKGHNFEPMFATVEVMP